MSDRYILNGKTPVPCEDLETWARWFEDGDNRKVAADFLCDGQVKISTVFLGLNHRFQTEGPPLLFETMIFGGPHDETMFRYSTWDEAVAGHQAALQLARSGLN